MTTPYGEHEAAPYRAAADAVPESDAGEYHDAQTNESSRVDAVDTSWVSNELIYSKPPAFPSDEISR